MLRPLADQLRRLHETKFGRAAGVMVLGYVLAQKMLELVDTYSETARKVDELDTAYVAAGAARRRFILESGFTRRMLERALVAQELDFDDEWLRYLEEVGELAPGQAQAFADMLAGEDQGDEEEPRAEA